MGNSFSSLKTALEKVLSESQATGFNKLSRSLLDLSRQPTQQRFFYLFAICPRWFDKHSLTGKDQNILASHDPFSVIRSWQYTQAARLLVLLTLAEACDKNVFIIAVNELFKTADVNEQLLLIQSLNFIPYSEAFIDRAREAARSNIESVFCAVAHNNHYASQYFDLAGWNQLILKAAFLAVPIWPIIGLKERNNDQLIMMLRDYSLERHAASRAVPWDLYICTGWLSHNETLFTYLESEFMNGNNKIRAAILLSLRENPNAAANNLALHLAKTPKGHTETQNWADIARMKNE